MGENNIGQSELNLYARFGTDVPVNMPRQFVPAEKAGFESLAERQKKYKLNPEVRDRINARRKQWRKNRSPEKQALEREQSRIRSSQYYYNVVKKG